MIGVSCGWDTHAHTRYNAYGHTFYITKFFATYLPPLFCIVSRNAARLGHAPASRLDRQLPVEIPHSFVQVRTLPLPSKSSPRSPRTSQDQLAPIEGLALGFSSPPLTPVPARSAIIFPVLVPATFIFPPARSTRDPINLFVFGPERPCCRSRTGPRRTGCCFWPSTKDWPYFWNKSTRDFLFIFSELSPRGTYCLFF